MLRDTRCSHARPNSASLCRASRRRAPRHPARTDRNALPRCLHRRGSHRRHIERRARRATFLILSRIPAGDLRERSSPCGDRLSLFLPPRSATSALAQTYPSSIGNLSVESVASGLANPWALAFLPTARCADRKARSPAHRRARRQALAAGRGRAAGARVGSGRIARRRARSQLRAPTRRSISATPSLRPAAGAPTMARARLK